MYFKSIIETDDEIGIPVLESNEICWLLWKVDELPEDVIKRSNNHNFFSIYDQFTIWNAMLDDDQKIYTTIYEVTCYKSKIKYYLITYRELDNYENIFNSVCVHYNYLNVLKFFKDYLLPFENKIFFRG